MFHLNGFALECTDHVSCGQFYARLVSDSALALLCELDLGQACQQVYGRAWFEY